MYTALGINFSLGWQTKRYYSTW